MKLDFLRKQYVITAMTAYPVFCAHSYHGGEFWRLKDLIRQPYHFVSTSTLKLKKKLTWKSTLFHDFLFSCS